METGRPISQRAFWGLIASLAIPSSAIIQKYLGLAGVAVYALAAILALWAALRYGWIEYLADRSERAVIVLALLTFLLLGLAFAMIYPAANAGVMGGGSDADDALNLAARALVAGRYPYGSLTYLGNPISPLPGAIFLALPFVALGNSAYQNLFWLAVFALVMARYLRDGGAALALAWTTLILGPVVVYALVTGQDYLANSLYVLAFSWALLNAHGGWERAGWAALLGLALASRANFLLLVPLILAELARRTGRKSALAAVGLALAVATGITLPFYLYEPAGFTPLHTFGELGRFGTILPGAGVLVPAAAALLALGLALRRGPGGDAAFFRDSAWVQALPVGAGVILSSIAFGRLDLSFAYFGLFFLFFGVAAAWPAVSEN